MKTAGLSSKVRNAQKHTTKARAFTNLKEIHLGAKERQKSLRLQAEQAQIARKKKDSERA